MAPIGIHLQAEYKLDPQLLHGCRTQVPALVAKGRRPYIPEDRSAFGCPCLEEYPYLMDRCWHQDPGMRPDFEHIAEDLDRQVSLVEVIPLWSSFPVSSPGLQPPSW